MKRPLSLVVGVVLQWVASVVSLLIGLDLISSAFAMSKSGVAENLEATLVAAGITDVRGSIVVMAVFVAGVVVSVISIVRLVVSGYLIQGRAWARMVITVLIGISIVEEFALLFKDNDLWAILVIAIDVVMIILLFTSASSAFIKERSASRAEELAATS